MNLDKLIAAREKAAQSCISKAEKINTEVTRSWTHRRQRFADHAQKKKDNLLRYALILQRLCEEAKVNPESHSKAVAIKSSSDIEFVFYEGYPKAPDENSGDWYKEKYPTTLKKAEKLGMHSKEDAAQLRIYLNDLSETKLSEQELKSRELKQAIQKIRSSNIAGFFPTPDELIDEMIEYAQIEPGMFILEPSAGLGSILDRIKDKFGNTVTLGAIERQYSLYEILKLKGYNANCVDILETEYQEYDRILMNPPFEKGQDIEHILHCFNKLLKPGGILVAIASMSWTFVSNKKSEEFRRFLGVEFDGPVFTGTKYMQKLDSSFESETSQLTAMVKCNPDGSFKDAFNSTGVQTTMIILKKKIQL